MRSRGALALVSVLAALPGAAYPQSACVAPPLSDQQVKDIIQNERETRTDLPKPFPKYRWLVRKDGCYYVYIEYGLPEAPEYNQIFKINQRGVIVDVQMGAESVKGLKCPDKTYTETELAEIVKKERAKRADLPPEFPKYKTRLQRMRCLYLYFEYALPERRGEYQVFTIDPFGELMEFSRSQPY